MRIESVRFLNDFIIELVLSNQKIVQYDFKPNLKTARFKHIHSQDFFKQGVLKEHCSIYWDPVTEIQDYEMLGIAYIKEDL